MTGVARVLFISVVPSPYQRDLFRALAKRKEFAVTVCYLEPVSPDSPWPQRQLASYEKVIPGSWFTLGPARFHFNWGLPDLRRYDMVILNIPVNGITTQWLMRCGLRGTPWIFWGERLRGQTSRWKAFRQRLLIGALQHASAIVGIGRAAQNDYQQRFPTTRHFCIPYHCDLTEFLNIRRQDDRSLGIRFLFCGQMIRRKGVDLLLTAFDRLIAKGLNAYLLLVGREAELPQFLRVVSSASHARIHYAGFQPPERLPEFFAKADVFVLPSRHDGWGVVVNQALGAGLPVISSDAVGAGYDLVEEEVNGLRIAAGNPDQLERAMKRLACSPETVRQWGEASRHKAAAMVPEAGAEKWMCVLRKILGAEK
jgi:glycosyltransferase involved in cell wall biosynthesis